MVRNITIKVWYKSVAMCTRREYDLFEHVTKYELDEWGVGQLSIIFHTDASTPVCARIPLRQIIRIKIIDEGTLDEPIQQRGIKNTVCALTILNRSGNKKIVYRDYAAAVAAATLPYYKADGYGILKDMVVFVKVLPYKGLVKDIYNVNYVAGLLTVLTGHDIFTCTHTKNTVFLYGKT